MEFSSEVRTKYGLPYRRQYNTDFRAEAAGSSYKTDFHAAVCAVENPWGNLYLVLTRVQKCVQ